MNDNASNSTQGIAKLSLADIFSFFKSYWRELLLSGLISGSIGYGTSWLVSDEYEVKAKVLPEFPSGLEGNTDFSSLRGLANLAGITLGNNKSKAMRPYLYPDVLSSLPFLLKLLSASLPTSNMGNVNLITYIEKEAEPLSAKQVAQRDTLVVLSAAQARALKNVESRVTAEIDRISGTLTIRIEMPDPTLAAACASFTISYLRAFVSEYRVSKESEKMNFLKRQLAIANEKNRRAMYALNVYRDHNQNTYTNLSKIEEQGLLNESMQAQALREELSRQYKTARIRGLEATAILKILDPPMIPNQRSRPKRILYTIGFAILGGMLSIVFLVVRQYR